MRQPGGRNLHRPSAPCRVVLASLLGVAAFFVSKLVIFEVLMLRQLLISSLLFLGVAAPSMAQRSSSDPRSAGDDWLDRCRDNRNNDRERYCEVRERRLS